MDVSCGLKNKMDGAGKPELSLSSHIADRVMEADRYLVTSEKQFLIDVLSPLFLSLPGLPCPLSFYLPIAGL